MLGTPPKTCPLPSQQGVFFLHPNGLAAYDVPTLVGQLVSLVLAEASDLCALHKLNIPTALKHLRAWVHLPITKIV